MGEIFDLLLELARERGIIQKEKGEENQGARSPEEQGPAVTPDGTTRGRKNLRSLE